MRRVSYRSSPEAEIQRSRPGRHWDRLTFTRESGLGRMDAITAFAWWPNSIDKIAHAVPEPDLAPTAQEICDVARAIGDGDVRIIVNGDRANLRGTQRVILGCLRLAATVQEEDDGGPIIPKKVMSYWINALVAAVGTLVTVVLLIFFYG